ncbi:hypothetical protein C7999DRAFT_17272 [Corynascus novoguineensis]|uniref:Apple domain-containing protein n=1 Tax=Corynascus novoguineensis TaxID=1126955 RepID=A0AAN7CPF5_9PEZI|nr:hypothetical protein C7999DRAFT_17272 [Corynascus novoguineensis]
MLSPELQDGERRVFRRQNQAPCPSGNGTTIGTAQEFTVLCNTILDGDFLNRLDAFDFTACVDLCSSSHPKCEATSFDGSNCVLKARLQPSERRLSRRIDTAIATFPGASSNCPTLGGAQEALGTRFTTMCGFIIDGNDISQNFAPTFQDCLGQCAATSGCAALSFDPSLDLGFKNCYLKTAVTNSSDIAADRRTDSAMVAMAAAPAPSDDSSSGPAIPGVSTIPVPSSAPAGGGGAIFFTPPPGPSTMVASSLLGTSNAVPTPESSLPAGTPLITSLTVGSDLIPLPDPSIPPVSSTEAAPDAAAGQDAGNGSQSMAWVAAPVVGGVAAISLIAVSFVLLRRRRRGTGIGAGGEIEGKSGSSGSSGLAGLLDACLPAAWSSSPRRGGSRGKGKTMTGMGNFSQVASGRRSVEVSRAGVRNSVVGFMTGRPMGMERLEDIEEGEGGTVSRQGVGQNNGSATDSEEKNGRVAELRASLNGLGQNKWSQ